MSGLGRFMATDSFPEQHIPPVASSGIVRPGQVTAAPQACACGVGTASDTAFSGYHEPLLPPAWGARTGRGVVLVWRHAVAGVVFRGAKSLPASPSSDEEDTSGRQRYLCSDGVCGSRLMTADASLFAAFCFWRFACHTPWLLRRFCLPADPDPAASLSSSASAPPARRRLNRRRVSMYMHTLTFSWAWLAYLESRQA